MKYRPPCSVWCEGGGGGGGGGPQKVLYGVLCPEVKNLAVLHTSCFAIAWPFGWSAHTTLNVSFPILFPYFTSCYPPGVIPTLLYPSSLDKVPLSDGAPIPHLPSSTEHTSGFCSVAKHKRKLRPEECSNLFEEVTGLREVNKLEKRRVIALRRNLASSGVVDRIG